MQLNNFDESFSLEGKNAIITGACSGIGLETAKMFARKGANIFSFDVRVSDELETYVKEQGRQCVSYAGDITMEADILEAVQTACSQLGKPDVLVNCAGIGGTETAENTSEDMWDRIIAVDLKGTVRMTQAVGKVMLANGGGKIVNIGSQAGVVALDRHLAYGSAKAGVIYATKQFAMEWAKHNINVNCISPTVILTKMVEDTWTEEEKEVFLGKIPARRFGYPKEIAACAAFLSSDAATLLNGANVVVDGGYTIA